MIFIFGNQAEATNYTVKDMKTFKTKVFANISNFQKTFTITYKGNPKIFSKEIGNVEKKILKENPIYDGVINSTQIQQKFYSDKVVTTYKIRYAITKTEFKKSLTEAKKVSDQIKKTAKSDFDKVKAVNDYIAKNTMYSKINGNYEYTIYGVLVKKKAVCQGYALTTYQILKNLNVDVQYVVGTSKGVAHAWNKVKIDGIWYNLDVTWNDPIKDVPYQSAYNNFLLSDKTFEKTHKWNKKDYTKSTATRYDFLANATYMTRVGNEIYYTNNNDKNKMYKYDMKKMTRNKVSDNRPQYIHAYNGKVYFSDYSNGGYLTSYDTKTKKTTVMKKAKSDYIHIDKNVLNYKVGNKWNKITVK